MLQKMTEQMKRSVRRIHNDEHGMESLQSVIILALAAIVLVALKGIYDDSIEQNTTDRVTELINP